jgi:excisionase family DNA binding protein
MGRMMVAMTSGVEKLFEGYPDERLDPDQVAEALGITPNTVRRWLRDGDIPGYRPSRGSKASWVIVKSELIADLKTRRNQDLPEAAHTKAAHTKE